MPNYIDNLLTVIGEPDAVTAFVAAARGRHPKTGDKDGENATNAPNRPTAFNFHSLVPLPDEYGRNPYGDMSARCGYNLERETWGIKWGASKPSEPACEPGLATYSFETPWDGPHAVFMPKVSVRFPHLVFLLSWGGEGPTRGRAAFVAGAKIGGAEKYRAEDYPPTESDADGEEIPGAWDAYKAVQNVRLTTHPLWVGWVVAHRAGRTFDPVGCAPVLADWLQDHGLDGLAGTVRAMDPATDPGPVLEGVPR